MASIGKRLRHRRRLKSLTLYELARRVGCSESLLSKVETGRVRPSARLLGLLAATLEIDPALLVDGEDDGPLHILPAGSRPAIRLDGRLAGAGMRIENLAPGGDHLLQAAIHHIEPGGCTSTLHRHDGEQIGYVLEGVVELVVGGAVHRLGPGDSFFLRAENAHGYRNPGDRPARVLCCITPPTF